MCPLRWNMDYISKVLGTVTQLDLELHNGELFQTTPQAILSFLKPSVYLRGLTLFRPKSVDLDKLTRLLTTCGSDVLPELEALSISEYPFWFIFFQYIQQWQSGFWAGEFQTALKEISIKTPVHGVLLENLRGSLAGRYVSLIRVSPCKGSNSSSGKHSLSIDRNLMLMGFCGAIYAPKQV